MNHAEKATKSFERIARKYLKKRVKNFDKVIIAAVHHGGSFGIRVWIEPAPYYAFSRKTLNQLENVFDGLANRLFFTKRAANYRGFATVRLVDEKDNELKVIEI